ncbi:MAG TPA: DUF2147 domain-containing protein [Stellaceae bacterium]|nr:DUF2147 domain-containing protein [Stellaceae bacterium]
MKSSMIARRGLAALAIAAPLAFVPAAARAGDIAGLWLVEAKDAVIDIAPCGERLCGAVVWLKEPRPNGQVRLDDKNPDPALRARPVCGLRLLYDFKASGENEWEDGHIYSADEGATYAAKMALLDANTLKVRGFVGISLFGKSQVWTRAAADTPRCATA